MANGLNACYVRPLVLRGYGEMGVNPLDAPVNVVIAVWPWGAYLGGRARAGRPSRSAAGAGTTRTRCLGREGDRAVHQLGPGQGGEPEGRLRRGDHAERVGFRRRFGENVFVVRDGVLLTPISAGCLDGITRGSVIASRGSRYEVREENLVRTDLYNADELFFTGTAAEITPIREVDDRVVGEGHRGP